MLVVGQIDGFLTQILGGGVVRLWIHQPCGFSFVVFGHQQYNVFDVTFLQDAVLDFRNQTQCFFGVFRPGIRMKKTI